MPAESGDGGPELEIPFYRRGQKGYSRDGGEEKRLGESKVLSEDQGDIKYMLLVGEDKRNSNVGD